LYAECFVSLVNTLAQSSLPQVANQPEATRLLLERGADPNLVTGDVGSDNPMLVPLFAAISRHGVATMRVLIEHGATVDAMVEPNKPSGVLGKTYSAFQVCMKTRAALPFCAAINLLSPWVFTIQIMRKRPGLMAVRFWSKRLCQAACIFGCADCVEVLVRARDAITY
jgi:hypothetical protein